MATPYARAGQASCSNPSNVSTEIPAGCPIYKFKNPRQQLAYNCYRESESFERYGHRLNILNQQTPDKLDIPNERSLRTTDLDDVHEFVLRTGRQMLQPKIPAGLLNLGVECTTSVDGENVQAYTLHSPKSRMLSLCSDQLGFPRPDLVTRSERLARVAAEVTSNAPSKLNALIINPEPTHLAVCSQLIRAKEYRHVFVVSCAGHALRTLTERIMSVPLFAPVVKACRDIARLFTYPRRCRQLQERILQDHGTSHAVPLYFFIERGMNYGLIRSVHCVKKSMRNLISTAIASWNNRDDVRILERIIGDDTFWHGLRMLDTVLEPIDDAIRRVELGKTGLQDVVSEWQMIYNVLDKIQRQRIPRLDRIDLPETVQRVCREQISCSPATIVAHMLHPVNLTKPVTLIESNTAMESLVTIARQTEQDPKHVVRDLAALQAVDITPKVDSVIWNDDELKSFYAKFSTRLPALAKVVDRVFATPCSLMPAEHSISATTTLLSEARNGLDFRGRDSLLSIFNNDRVIRGAGLWSTAIDDENVNKALKLLEEDVVAAASVLTRTSGR